MAITFRTPEEVAAEYLLDLKSLKPEVNTDQTDSDWWIRGQVIGGVVSGLYADQQLIADDAFPQSARHEALDRHLFTYFGGTFLPGTEAQGSALASGATGSFMPAGTQAVYGPNGNTYQTTEDLTLVASTGFVPIKSVNTGQDQNLLGGTVLTISSPPSGFDPTLTAASGGITDGKDPETDQQAAARILDRIRSPIAGGTASDYVQFSKAADPSVNTVQIERFFRGLGTVGVFITAGTTDIDKAIDNGDAITFMPSDALVDIVQAYLDDHVPLTDCPTVLKPSSISQDVTVKVSYANGGAGTVPAGQTLTQEQLVQREVRRAIYKTPIGGRQIAATGFILASDIEQAIDLKLSDEALEQGTIPILLDRQVQNLSASGANRRMLFNEVVIPGTITVTTF